MHKMYNCHTRIDPTDNQSVKSQAGEKPSIGNGQFEQVRLERPDKGQQY